MTNYWCVNFDFDECLKHGLEKNLWMMQYQYALDEDHVFQGERKGSVTANWRRTKYIQAGDWFVAYLPKKKSANGNAFFAIGQVREPRKLASPSSSVSTVEEYIDAQSSHDVANGVVRYSDAPMFYEDFDDSWFAADYPELKYAQRIDVDQWKHIVPGGVPWLSKLDIEPYEIQRAFFKIEKSYFDEIAEMLAAANGTNSERNSRDQQSWVFQANPNQFDLTEALKHLRIFRWRVTKFKDRIRSGDDVYVWLSGSEGGLVARGTVITNPNLMGNAPEEVPYMLEEPEEEKRLSVAIEIHSVLDHPISRVTLKDHATLSSLSILKQPQGTNFSLTDIQAESLDLICPLTKLKPLSMSEAFAQFRKNPSDQLRVRIRRERAKQLREILADYENIDLEFFNREVWVLESETLLNGNSIKGQIYGGGLSDAGFRKQISEALDIGSLELHGNSIWDSGSGIYGTRPKDRTDEQKLVYVRQALKLLNDQTLSASAKAIQIEAVSGFGFAISTGLAILLHPDEIAIKNKQTEGAFEKLQFSYKGFDEFQAAATSLKNELNAADFLELDWFLYQINQEQITITDREQQEQMLSDLDDEVRDNIFADLTVSQTEKEQLVKSRIGQGLFRKNIQRLEKACRVSGISDTRFLIASHIRPWRACSNEERLDGENGLFLSPNIDHLFDEGYISFSDNGDLLISSAVSNETLHRLGIPSTTLHCGSFSPKQQMFLAYHRKYIFDQTSS